MEILPFPCKMGAVHGRTRDLGLDSFSPALVFEKVSLDALGFCYPGL